MFWPTSGKRNESFDKLKSLDLVFRVELIYEKVFENLMDLNLNVLAKNMNDI